MRRGKAYPSVALNVKYRQSFHAASSSDKKPGGRLNALAKAGIELGENGSIFPRPKRKAKCKRCRKEFCRKRTAKDYCSAQCRKASWSHSKKRHLMPSRRGILGSVQNAPFSPTKTGTCKPPHTPDLGAFVQAQIVTQEDEPNPIGFTLPDGTKGRVWLASDRDHSKIIGDDRLWSVNTEELLRQKERRFKTTPWTPTAEALRRPIIVVGRNDPVRDVDDALGAVKGFKLRICIESEKELQVLGCGWRIVTCQFRSDKVLLHHNGSIATMKRKAFKELLAALRAVRLKKRRPSLRLVVSNPVPRAVEAEAA
jgi:hypothetical protein